MVVQFFNRSIEKRFRINSRILLDGKKVSLLRVDRGFVLIFAVRSGNGTFPAGRLSDVILFEFKTITYFYCPLYCPIGYLFVAMRVSSSIKRSYNFHYVGT